MIGTRYSPKSEIASILMDENPRITSTHRQTRKSLAPRPTRIEYSVVLGSIYISYRVFCILPISILLIVDFISGLLKTIIDRVLATKPNNVIIVKSTPRIMKFANSSFPTWNKIYLDLWYGYSKGVQNQYLSKYQT